MNAAHIPSILTAHYPINPKFVRTRESGTIEAYFASNLAGLVRVKVMPTGEINEQYDHDLTNAELFGNQWSAKS